MEMKRKTRSPLDRKPLRNPGESIQEERRRLMEDEIIPATMMAIIVGLIAAREWANWYFNLPPQPIAVSVAALPFVGYGAYKFVTIRKRMAALRLGLEGEKFVGQYLEELRAEGCRVFNDLVGTDSTSII